MEKYKECTVCGELKNIKEMNLCSNCGDYYCNKENDIDCYDHEFCCINGELEE